VKQRIEGCDLGGELLQTRTPFDKLRTGFDTASTLPFDYALRQAQDIAQDGVSAYSGCWSRLGNRWLICADVY